MDISKIHRQLMSRREQILNQREKTNDSWQQLQEQEVELEENAAKDKMAEVLAQLDDQEKEEIELIDRALAKIKASALGICESCGRHISERRLEAIPWTPLCIECAENHQSGPSTAVPSYEKKMQGKAEETDVWVSQEFGTPMEPPDQLNPEKK